MNDQPGQQPIIHPVFEPNTNTWQYIIADPHTRHAAVIDPVLDFDPATSTISTTSADGLLDIIRKEGYNVLYLLETHVHADHLTAAHYLQQSLTTTMHESPIICIGKRIEQVEDTFAHKYGIPHYEYAAIFDRLWEDEEEFLIGNLKAKVLHLPGHTPDHVGYMIGANVFTGDSIFNPDVGSARCDFPGGDAAQLFESIKRLLSLPGHYKLYTGHDYPLQSVRVPKAFSTVKEQKKTNKCVAAATEGEFVSWRTQRDRTLAEPRFIHQALQINIRAGRMPEQNEHGLRLLHVPVKASPTLLLVIPFSQSSMCFEKW